jgi:hypothetical protein
LDPKLVFPSQRTLSKKILLFMVMRCVDLYVQLQLDATPTVTTTFDLWMSRNQQDTFVFDVNFLLVDWKPHHWPF